MLELRGPPRLQRRQQHRLRRRRRSDGARRILGGTSSNCVEAAPLPGGRGCPVRGGRPRLVHECAVLANHPPRLARARPVQARGRRRRRRPPGGVPHRGRGRRLLLPVPAPTPPADLASGRWRCQRRPAHGGGAVTWLAVPDPSGAGCHPQPGGGGPRFDGGEGLWYDDGVVHFTTKGRQPGVALRRRHHQPVDPLPSRRPCSPVLGGVDSLVVSLGRGVFVRGDGALRSWSWAGGGRCSPFLRITSRVSSELPGPAFSPDGGRLYVSSQRGNGFGITYGVRGPFR